MVNGIDAVISLDGKSAVARIGAMRWSKSTTIAGLPIYDCDLPDAAIELAAQYARRAYQTGQAVRLRRLGTPCTGTLIKA